MSINPNDVDVITVDKLDDLTIALSSFFAHTNLNGKLGKATIQDLATFLTPIISQIGSSGFVAISGTVMPNPGVPSAFAFVGAGTFTKVGQANVVTIEPLNLLGWNGSIWSLLFGIPIDLTGYVAKTDIINDLTTGGIQKALSAEQGKLINQLFLRKNPQTDYLLSLVKYTPNLYIDSNVQLDKYINPANGAVTTLTNPIISDYIPVDPAKTYSIKFGVDLGLTNFKTISFYNSSKVSIGYSSRNNSTGLPVNTNCNVSYNSQFGWDTGALPSGTAYVVFSIRGNDTSTTWTTANIAMREGNSTTDIVSTIITDTLLQSALLPYIKKDELGSFNSYTPTYVEGSLFNVAGGGAGNIAVGATWLRTDLMPITAGETLFVKGVLGGGNFYIVFFNSSSPSNATYISNIKPNYAPDALKVYDFIVPAGATHLGFNIGTNTTYTFTQLKAPFKFAKNQSFSSLLTLNGYTVKNSDIINNSQLVWNSGGDSITWQDGKVFTTGPDAGNLCIGYQTIVRKNIAFKNHNNLAVSGYALSASSPDDGKCWVRLSATWPIADVFTLAHGTNDFGLNRPLGTTNDYINKTGDLTFYGALREFIDYCYTANPKYKIILFTPLQRTATYNTWTPNALGFTLTDYSNAVKWAGVRESLSVIDLLSNSGINMKNSSQFLGDGLHPTNSGYQVMATQVVPEMKKLNFIP